MRMFKRQADESTADDRPAAAPVTTTRPWHGPTRARATLLGVGAAGFLAWLTTNIDDKTTGGYWAAYGILAGAGLAIALSQLVGGWTKWGRVRLSPTVFLLAFVPTLVAVGWILVFHQPHANWFRTHAVNWSGDIGIGTFVKDMGGDLLTLLSFGLGLVFGFSFETTGPALPATPTAAAATGSVPADEPLTREREVVRS